jgi:hypothetical protein
MNLPPTQLNIIQQPPNEVIPFIKTWINYFGFFLSFALAIGSMCSGVQPIAGVIFLSAIILTLSLTLFVIKSPLPYTYNTAITSYTFLYILLSSIYTNGVTIKSFGFVAVMLTALSLIINVIMIYLSNDTSQPNAKNHYFGIFIIYSILGGITSWIVSNINPNFSIINNGQVSNDNTKCNTNPSSTFKCSFISNEDGTEINLDDIIS